ncbi:MAG TPA: hypothetical protein DEA27_00500 [Candidatus Moranbacteria bacterium]|nr:hypothetical protein [Candidatus Moranbacteria bacterium]
MQKLLNFYYQKIKKLNFLKINSHSFFLVEIFPPSKISQWKISKKKRMLKQNFSKISFLDFSLIYDYKIGEIYQGSGWN